MEAPMPRRDDPSTLLSFASVAHDGSACFVTLRQSDGKELELEFPAHLIDALITQLSCVRQELEALQNLDGRKLN